VRRLETPTSLSERIDLSILTKTERAVAIDVARGFTLQEIATRYVISPLTLKNKLTAIYAKMEISGASPRTTLAVRIWQRALHDLGLMMEIKEEMGV
jgi:DNA-binding NarL/FixJ family response regulator